MIETKLANSLPLRQSATNSNIIVQNIKTHKNTQDYTEKYAQQRLVVQAKYCSLELEVMIAVS